MIWRNASPTSRSEPVTPGTLGVRRVAEEEVDAAVPDLGQPSHVRAQPVDRRVVDLVVAGVQHAQVPRLEHDRDGVGNGVRHADELGAEPADLHRAVVRARLLELGRVQETVLVELGLEKAERQPRPPDLRNLDLAHQIRQRADVVLVRVREQNRPHLVCSVAQIREVREDEVDAEMLVTRKGEARVDDDDLPVRLENGQVLADLAEPAERDDAQSFHGVEPIVALSGGLVGVPPSGGGPICLNPPSLDESRPWGRGLHLTKEWKMLRSPLFHWLGLVAMCLTIVPDSIKWP